MRGALDLFARQKGNFEKMAVRRKHIGQKSGNAILWWASAICTIRSASRLLVATNFAVRDRRFEGFNGFQRDIGANGECFQGFCLIEHLEVFVLEI